MTDPGIEGAGNGTGSVATNEAPPVVARSKDLGNVALKFAGLYLLWCGVITLPVFFVSLSIDRKQQAGPILSSAAYVVVFFVLGAALVRWSSNLSDRLFAGSASAGIPVPLARDLQTVAFRVMGVYVLATSIPALAQWLVEMAQTGTPRELAPVVAGCAVQIAVGMALVLYRNSSAANTWARFWGVVRPMSGGDGPQ